jgi:hypothetical protein
MKRPLENQEVNLPINIIHIGRMLGKGWKVLTKKKMEITFFKLENKQKMTRQGKVDFTFMRTCYLINIAKTNQNYKISR